MWVKIRDIKPLLRSNGSDEGLAHVWVVADYQLTKADCDANKEPPLNREQHDMVINFAGQRYKTVVNGGGVTKMVCISGRNCVCESQTISGVTTPADVTESERELGFQTETVTLTTDQITDQVKRHLGGFVATHKRSSALVSQWPTLFVGRTPPALAVLTNIRAEMAENLAQAQADKKPRRAAGIQARIDQFDSRTQAQKLNWLDKQADKYRAALVVEPLTPMPQFVADPNDTAGIMPQLSGLVGLTWEVA